MRLIMYVDVRYDNYSIKDKGRVTIFLYTYISIYYKEVVQFYFEVD